MNKQSLNSFAETLKDLGYIQLTADSYSNSLIMGLYDDDRMERARVVVNPLSSTVIIESGNQSFVYGALSDSLKKAKELAETKVVRNLSEEELSAARLVREVRTLRLAPDEKLAIIVKDGSDSEQLQSLHEFVLRWLGEKDSRKVMIMMGDIEMVKVKQ